MVSSSGDVIDFGNVGVHYSYGILERLVHQISINYWWLRTPNTYSDGYAYLVNPSGGVDGGGINFVDVYDSYGIWLKYATKFIQKYWWLRSPDVYNDYNAWDVRSSGEIDDGNDDDIGYSYGRLISPNMDVDIEDVWGVRSNGVIIYVSNVYDHSYGQSYIIKVRFTTRIISVLYMKGAIKYEIY